MQESLKRPQLGQRSLTPSGSESEDNSVCQQNLQGGRKRVKGHGPPPVTRNAAHEKIPETPSRLPAELAGDSQIEGLDAFPTDDIDPFIDAALASSTAQESILNLSQPSGPEPATLVPSPSYSSTQGFQDTLTGHLFMADAIPDLNTLNSDFALDFEPGLFPDEDKHVFDDFLTGSDLILGNVAHCRFSIDSGIGDEGLLQRCGNAVTERGVTVHAAQTSFDTFHQSWPILHHSAICVREQSTFLSDAIAPFTTPLQPLNSHRLFSVGIYEELTKDLTPKVVRTPTFC